MNAADLAQSSAPSGPTRATRLAAATTLLFAGLTVAILRRLTVVQGVDDHIHGWVVANRSTWSVSLARVVTWGGSTAFVLPALFVVGAISPRRGRSAWDRWGGGLLLAGIGGFGVYVGLAINAWVGRPRPPIEVWAGVAGGPSFPSGHTTTATLFAVVCAWVLTARATPGRARATLWTGAVMYALAVGWSRVWLGVHWPSDVTGGLLYGVAWCATCMAVASWWRWRRGRGAAIRGTLLTLARHRFDARHREVPLSSGDPPAAPGMLVSAAGAGQRLMLACGRIVAWSEGFR